MASSSAGLPGPPSRVTRRSPWYGQRGARPPPHAGGEWSRAATAADGSRRRILRRRSMLNPVIEDRRPAQDAAELGRSVPGNVRIVCGSDSEHTRSSSSQITSVDLRPELLAKIAVTTLVNRRDGLDRPLPTGEVRGRLIVRESTRHQTHNADLAVSCRDCGLLSRSTVRAGKHCAPTGSAATTEMAR